MATRTATITPNLENSAATLIVWTGLLNGDDGSAVDWTRYADRSVQFTGTFGTGGSISLQGSNNGTDWVILNDLQGSVVTKTSAGLEGVAELTRYVRPIVTAGDGTTNLVATMIVRAS
jgi:hypothetical protein